jgi:leucyl/phenylalanyl-tRNA---protein transferase
MTTVRWLRGAAPFPPVDTANDALGGLLCAGGDLSPTRLLDAYARGIYPWFGPDEPILWWSPNPRMVLQVDELRVSRSLARRMRTAGFTWQVNTAFRPVIEACAAAPRIGQNGTWIVPEMIEAYCELHALGYAHSVETWRDGVLVGGLYGVAIGRMFFGESMFARETDASKTALVMLARMLRAANMPMIDCQQQTAHLASFGARPIARTTFSDRLNALIPKIEPAQLTLPPV